MHFSECIQVMVCNTFCTLLVTTILVCLLDFFFLDNIRFTRYFLSMRFLHPLPHGYLISSLWAVNARGCVVAFRKGYKINIIDIDHPCTSKAAHPTVSFISSMEFAPSVFWIPVAKKVLFPINSAGANTR